MKLLISAAEASSDLHGSHMLESLHSFFPGRVDAFGVGGPALKGAGLRTVVDASELLAMGSVEVLGKLPRILGALRSVEERSRSERPDLAIMIDYPDFHFRLAKKLNRQGIPLVYYIPPKVWVWRQERLKVIRDLFKHVICIFPFEEQLYRDSSIPVTYVGNPVVDSLPMTMTREQARSAVSTGMKQQDRVLLLMPGSRPAELKNHLDLMLDAAVLSAARFRQMGFLGMKEQLKVVIPVSRTLEFENVERRVSRWLYQVSGGTARRGSGSSFILDVHLLRGCSAESMIAADVGLVKSGTSTLEAGILGCPHAVVYKPSWLTGWIFNHFISYSGPVGLVNLFQGWKPGRPYVVSEILCGSATVSRLADEVVSLFTNQQRRMKMQTDLGELKKSVLGGRAGGSPSVYAAQTVMEVFQRCSKDKR